MCRPCTLYSIKCLQDLSFLYYAFPLQEVELKEACYYGLVVQVHHLLTTGVNVNLTTFVSGQPDRELSLSSQCRASTICMCEHYTSTACATRTSLLVAFYKSVICGPVCVCMCVQHTCMWPEAMCMYAG